jgi:outer membrane protein OmpA-like peptidoglycan-associated protein
MRKVILYFLFILIQGFYFSYCFANEDIKILIPNHKSKLTTQFIDDTKLLVSATDADGNPIHGLGPDDFVIESGGKRAKIFTVAPFETSKDIPLNVVLVVDNSTSMDRRSAVQPLLAALDEFLKIVRPIDNIHVVVFDNKGHLKVNGYTLRAKTFSSNNGSDIRKFLTESLDKGLTGYTFLYEAMLAGLDLARKMPEKSNKFLVVFSDGEDLNSAIGKSAVVSEAQKISNLDAYSVDYMPGASVNSFLRSFAEEHGGRLWKAKSTSELLPIFRSFSTALLHRYVVTYRFSNPPQGTLKVEPTELNLSLLTLTDGTPILNQVFFEPGRSEMPREYVLLNNRTETRYFDETTLKTPLERYYNVLNLMGKRLSQNPTVKVRIVGCNSGMGAEEGNLDLSKQRAETIQSYLSKIWAVDPVRMEIGIRNLPTHASQADVLGGRAENRRVEIEYDSDQMQQDVSDQFVVAEHNVRDIKIYPQIEAKNSIADWELKLMSNNQVIKSLKGPGEVPSVYTIPLNEIGIGKMAKSHDLQAVIKVTDTLGDTYEAATNPVTIISSYREVIHDLIHPPAGQVAMEPSAITIEQVTTIESSPMLNYVFFETGKSEIPERYTLFSSRGEIKDFSERKLRGTMQKYYNILNVIGKRLTQFPDAGITIVGCNSDSGVEHGRIDLSRGRAEAVRAYLRYVWGIDRSRMTVEARNRPAAASANGTDKGRSDNQRAEIYSDFPAIMEPIKSTYVEETSNTAAVQVFPKITAGYGVSHWKIELTGDGVPIASMSGQGELGPSYTFNLKEIGYREIASYKQIKTDIEITDNNGQIQRNADAASCSVRFVKREEHIAQKAGYRVLEKYALVLFDFNSSYLNQENMSVIDEIIDRTKEFPRAIVEVVGHTDNIGEVDYNLWLSARRAKSVFDQITSRMTIDDDRITYVGSGPHNPLYDNNLPEGRALNRTVTVSLEYEKKGDVSLSSTNYD